MPSYIRGRADVQPVPLDASVVIERDIGRAGALQLDRVAKRAIDLFGSVLVLVLLSPLMLLIGVIIRLESSGPALFGQERMGKDGLPFKFYKFRTMFDGNDSSIHQQYVASLITSPSGDLAGEGGSFKIENDPRVTKFGRILRRTSMDELPQFLNVLMGQMSIVGPRPPLDYEVDLYSDRARRRLECLPGITGLWQVSGRCQKTFEEMIELDIEYVDNWSLALDLEIMARTPAVVFRRTGAW